MHKELGDGLEIGRLCHMTRTGAQYIVEPTGKFTKDKKRNYRVVSDTNKLNLSIKWMDMVLLVDVGYMPDKDYIFPIVLWGRRLLAIGWTDFCYAKIGDVAIRS